MIGNNLNVLISTCYNFHHEWLSFVSWYSIHRLLPEANFFICFTKTITDRPYFRWTAKAAVKQLRMPVYAAAPLVKRPTLIVFPGVIAVREINFPHACCSKDGAVYYLDGTEPNIADLSQVEGVCTDCTSNEMTQFTRIVDRCGDFSLSKWMNQSHSAPFTKKIKPNTPNEHAIAKIWSRLQETYAKLI